MSVQELRAQIIGDIQAVPDAAALQQVLDVLHSVSPFAREGAPDSDSVHRPTQAQLDAIRRGLADVQAGRVFFEEEANRQADAWRDEK